MTASVRGPVGGLQPPRGGWRLEGTNTGQPLGRPARRRKRCAMSRRTALTATVTAVALASSALLGTSAANAEAIVYKTRNVQAVAPGEDVAGAEHAAIEIPT